MGASGTGNAPFVRLLLARGADTSLTNAAGETALMLATRAGHAEAAELLKAAGAVR